MRQKIKRNIKRLIWKIKSAWCANEQHLFDLGRDLKVKYPLATAIGFALFSRDFETAELKFLRHHLEAGQTFFDIGANGGIFTVIAAQCVGDNGRVFAFEPGEYEYTLLQENVRLNNFDNVVVVKKAVSDLDGTRCFAVARDGAFSSLAQTTHPDQQIESWLEIETISLDTFVKEQGIKSVDFIKIDVEGAEKLVFDGASNLLKSNPNVCILFEAYELNTRGFSYTVPSFLESLQKNGFHIFFFGNAGCLHRAHSSHPDLGGELIQNFIAMRTPAILESKGYRLCG